MDYQEKIQVLEQAQGLYRKGCSLLDAGQLLGLVEGADLIQQGLDLQAQGLELLYQVQPLPDEKITALADAPQDRMKLEFEKAIMKIRADDARALLDAQAVKDALDTVNALDLQPQAKALLDAQIEIFEEN